MKQRQCDLYTVAGYPKWRQFPSGEVPPSYELVTVPSAIIQPGWINTSEWMDHWEKCCLSVGLKAINLLQFEGSRLAKPRK